MADVTIAENAVVGVPALLSEREGRYLQEFAEASMHCQRCRSDTCDGLHAVQPATPTVSLVLPSLNEEWNVPWVLGRIPRIVDEVILVDGRSSDNTVELARRLLPTIKVVHQTRRGKGDAIITGLLAASADVIVMMDLDGSMDPAEIPLFVGCLLAGADVAKGSRSMPGAGSDDLTILRRAGNYGLTKMANVLHGSRWSELCYGYAAFWRDSLDALGLRAIHDRAPEQASNRTGYGHGFEIETLLFCRAQRSGLRVAEVPCHEYRRRNGESNLVTLRDGARVVAALVKERAWRRSR